MYQVLIVAYLLVALALIGLVLIQQGKGADMGASFGAGASNTVFGSSGAGNFLTRSTALLATAFIVISLILGNLSSNQDKTGFSMSDTDTTIVAESVDEKTGTASDLPITNEAVAPVNQDVPVAEDVETSPATTESDVPQ